MCHLYKCEKFNLIDMSSDTRRYLVDKFTIDNVKENHIPDRY